MKTIHVKYSFCFISDYRLCFFNLYIFFYISVWIIQITQATVLQSYAYPRLLKRSVWIWLMSFQVFWINGCVLHIRWYDKPVKGLGWASGAWVQLVPCTSARALPWSLPFPLKAAGMSACYIKRPPWNKMLTINVLSCERTLLYTWYYQDYAYWKIIYFSLCLSHKLMALFIFYPLYSLVYILFSLLKIFLSLFRENKNIYH